MGRFGLLMLLVAMVIVVAALAGGWMALSDGGSPEPAVADTKQVIGEPSTGAVDSDMAAPPVLGISVPPSRVTDTNFLPATIETDSNSDSFADYGWAISLAIAASLAAIPIVGVYELRGVRLRGE
jgi:hypothetical protein